VSAVFVVCFMEHAELATESVTEILRKEAWQWFHVSADKVYVWQYNGCSLSSEHFLYLLNDIGKALACVTKCIIIFCCSILLDSIMLDSCNNVDCQTGHCNLCVTVSK